MNCPVCDSTMVTLSYEKVPLTIKLLGNIYLCQVPVCRCYEGDHVTHQLPKRKTIYDLVCNTLATLDRTLTREEHAFLLNRLHYNSPAYSRHMVLSDVDFKCWENDKYEVLPQADYLLNKRIIDKLKHSLTTQEVPPRKILCVELGNEQGQAINLDDCA